MALLYGRAGRLRGQNGGLLQWYWDGDWEVDGGGNSDRDGWEYSVNPTWSGPFGPTRDRASQVAMGGQVISMLSPPPMVVL